MLERAIGEARRTAEEGQRTKAEVAGLERRIETLEQVAGLLGSFADERQQEALSRIEGIVTMGLRSIFGDDMRLVVRTETRARRQESDLVIVSKVGGQEIETPIMDARGGGVAAVVGFLLRLIILMLTPGARRTMFLDEAFSHVSAEYEPALAEFMRELVDRTGVQIVLITHSLAYDDQADTLYRTSLVDGKTKIERVS